MKKDERTKLNEFLFTFEEFKQQLNGPDAANGLVEDGFIREYVQTLKDIEFIFPYLIKEYIPDLDYSHQGSNSNYYKTSGIKANISRNLSILKSKTEEVDFSPVTVIEEFNFIKDDLIKNILKRDYPEIQRSIISQNWKSTLILSLKFCISMQ